MLRPLRSAPTISPPGQRSLPLTIIFAEPFCAMTMRGKVMMRSEMLNTAMESHLRALHTQGRDTTVSTSIHMCGARFQDRLHVAQWLACQLTKRSLSSRQ